jgi:hypothetical protein
MLKQSTSFPKIMSEIQTLANEAWDEFIATSPEGIDYVAEALVRGLMVARIRRAVARGAPPPGKRPEIDNVKCRFEPEVQVIPVGGLDVVNTDPVLHNTHGYYGKRTAFNLGLPNKDQHIPVELKGSGTVRVDCDAHGWMEGWIYVVDNPYYAVTGADGKFSIGDVSPGDYKLVIAQPYVGRPRSSRSN